MPKAQDSNSGIQAYINENSLRLTKEQKKLIQITLKHEESEMLGSIDELQLFQLLLKSISAKKVLEIGTFTGYSAMTMALALPDDGKVVTLDITDENVQYNIIKEANCENKIKVELGPAVDTLNKFIDNGMENSFDFAFIDGDKENYRNYYELCLKLVRKNGIIAFDNILWKEKVADPNETDKYTNIMRNLTTFIKTDNRVDISLLTVGDGVLFCLKK